MLGKIIRFIGIVAIASWVIFGFNLYEGNLFSTSGALGADKSDVPVLKTGHKTWIGDNYYFVVDFDKKPQMGTVIMKIQVFTKGGQQDSSLEITGSTDMPSMRGAHSTGVQPFKLNKKGDYLLPVNVVMPGEWEVVVTFLKDKKTVFTGAVRFDV